MVAAVALLPAEVAEPAAAVADEAAAVADVAAADALVPAAAASTSSDHLATSVLVLIGCAPLEVCSTIHCQMLLFDVSLMMSLT